MTKTKRLSTPFDVESLFDPYLNSNPTLLCARVGKWVLSHQEPSHQEPFATGTVCHRNQATGTKPQEPFASKAGIK